MTRFWPGLLLTLVPLALIGGDDPFGTVARTKPLEPADALRSFDVQPGFRIELVAAEPLIRSPVAMEFDENGRLFVVEFPEYNQHVNPAFKERGCVKLLEDTDGDGRYDKATTFADNLANPVALACWDGGLFVGVVPDLWYFKDTDGDGKADVKRQVLTGFDRDKAGEAMLNSFRWGLDNRLLISTGLAGGNLRRADRPDAKPVSVRRQNIRFDPRTGDFTVTSGGGQHGLTIGDWGDVFTCDNSNPFFHVMYDGAYLARNPYVSAPSPLVDINAAGRFPNLHRLSPPEPWREVRTRLRRTKQFDGPDEGGRVFGFFTGATGVTVYRGDAWPAEFRGNLFVGEVANNLVYRARAEPKGLSWSAVRADPGREFLASRDIWFRPVQFANAPDGTLYVVDMYRELIETVESMPPGLLKHVDVAGGINRGRIYRIVPNRFNPRPAPRLGSATTSELVALLNYQNGWHRDTAARLLYQRQDRTAIPPLRAMLHESANPLAKLHAAYALSGLSALTADDVMVLLRDAESRLRIHGLRLAESLSGQPVIVDRMLAMTNDDDVRVRYQLAFSLGAIPAERAVEGLVKLARTSADDRWFRMAVECAAVDCGAALFARLLADGEFRGRSVGKSLLADLAGQVLSANRAHDAEQMGKALDALPEAEQELARAIVAAMLARPGNAAIPGPRSAKITAELLADARVAAVNPKASVKVRVTALHRLARLPFGEFRPLAEDCLNVRQPPGVQSAALESLARFDNSEVPSIILAAWPGMSPTIRATATETLFARPAWVKQLLDAVAAGRVRPADIEPARVQLLQRSIDPSIRTRAKELFRGVALSPRADVIKKYQGALKQKGDVARGKLVFKNVCSTCHRLDNEGTAVGPDLSTIRHKSADAVLLDILDPNREVLPKYYSYQLTTDAGVTITGLITAETANAVTIRRADGTSSTVQRVNIEQLASTGMSAMPEGLEKQVEPAAMADLLAYLLAQP